jgi:hypothetical protein
MSRSTEVVKPAARREHSSSESVIYVGPRRIRRVFQPVALASLSIRAIQSPDHGANLVATNSSALKSVERHGGGTHNQSPHSPGAGHYRRTVSGAPELLCSPRVVAEWTTRRRLDETSGLEKRPSKLLSARQIARLLTIARDQIPREQAYNMIQIERGVPALIAARDLVDRFHAMIRNRKPEELDPWIVAAKESGLASFATGIASDRDAVRAALVQPWSNGQTEGQITKLKLVKRQMYGRAKLDLLEARLIGAA